MVVSTAATGCAAGAPDAQGSVSSAAASAPSAGGTADSSNLTPQERVARAVEQAMVSRAVTAFDINARNLSDPAQFHGQGRIGMSPDGTKAAATHVLYEPGEDPWYPPDVVVIGNHAWVTPDNSPNTDMVTYGPTTYVGDAGAATDNLDVSNALQTRWLASPEHLAALLAHADHYRETDRGGRLLTGRVPLATLASDPAGAFFYRPYAKASPGKEVSFRIATSSNYLPVSLELTVPFPHDTSDYLSRYSSDPFSVEYRDWSKGQAITTPAPPPSPQWGGLPSQSDADAAQPSG
ncbi:hypothetical protein ACFXAW_02215 [Streptomyces sp. NPDC059445]|uniref:hypothetical protein n=1 Tax=Streptomyces sp. NPDC059445 TaxID=3346832 RepID=UPI00369F8DD2